VPARCGSTGSGRLGGAAAAGGGRDALSYGVSFATTRSHQLARGGGALTCFVTLARAREVFLNSQGRRDAARPDRAAWAVQRLLAAAATLSATGSASPRPDRTSWPGGLRRVLSAISGWFSLSILARGCRRIWRGEESGKQGRLLTNRPCSSLVYEESDSKERLRVSNWIVQRLYNDAVKKTVEL